jgi:hypothetical protein
MLFIHVISLIIGILLFCTNIKEKIKIKITRATPYEYESFIDHDHHHQQLDVEKNKENEEEEEDEEEQQQQQKLFAMNNSFITANMHRINSQLSDRSDDQQSNNNNSNSISPGQSMYHQHQQPQSIAISALDPITQLLRQTITTTATHQYHPPIEQDMDDLQYQLLE